MEEAEYQQRAAELALRLARPDIRQVQPTPQRIAQDAVTMFSLITYILLQTEHSLSSSLFPVDNRLQRQKRHDHVVLWTRTLRSLNP